MGFCFSFPVKQSAVAAGKVATLTKKFSNEGLVGCDPVQMLQAALRRLKAPVRFLAAPCPTLEPPLPCTRLVRPERPLQAPCALGLAPCTLC